MILAVDTAAGSMGVALVHDEKVIGSQTVSQRRRHAQTLFPGLQHLFKTCGVEPGSLEALAVSRGPGSYTGIRIGLTAVKTLAFVWECPVVAVDTLSGLAWQLRHLRGEAWAMLDARADRVYAAPFELGAQERLPVQKQAAAIRTVNELSRQRLSEDEGVILVGSGAVAYRSSWLAAGAVVFEDPTVHSVSAVGIARYAEAALQNEPGYRFSAEVTTATAVTPAYLQPSAVNETG